VFLIAVLIFLLSLVNIGQIVKKWQLCFEIQDGGRHLELRIFRFFVNTDVFLLKVATFLLNLAMIGQIVNIREWSRVVRVLLYEDCCRINVVCMRQFKAEFTTDDRALVSSAII